jgi:hypothetical protein
MPGGFVAGTTGGITSNPLFTNAGTRNFHLTSSSPCINAAGTVDNAVAATPALPYCRVWDIRHNDLIWGCNTKYHRVSGFHVNRDYDGVVCPVGNDFDMGAFEYH